MKTTDNDRELSRTQPIKPGSLSLMRKIVIACVGIEFVAIMTVIAGVPPMVFWVAIAAATIGAAVAFVMAWKIFNPLAGVSLAGLNALTCYRIWSVPFLIPDGGFDKYLFIVILLVRVIGWTALVIINRRARLFLGARETGGGA